MKYIVLVGVIGAMFAPTSHAGEDALCDHLREYAEAIPKKVAKSVTVKTEWGAEPTIGCVRGKDAASVELCKRLTETLSVESMSMNVRRVMRCLGTEVPGDSDVDPWQPLAGKVITEQPVSRKRSVRVEVSYDSTQKGYELPFLTLTFTRLP